MPPDREYIEAVLAEIENTLRFLRVLARVEQCEFVDDLKSCYSAAYGLMIAIEGVANIAAHIIAARGLDSPQGMAESFQVLQRAGVLRSRELAGRLADMARFRNLIVHRYWTVDYTRVHEILVGSLEDFALFAADVQAFLEEEEAG